MGKKVGIPESQNQNSLDTEHLLPGASNDYGFEHHFIWQNGRTVTDILDRNGPEIIRYALLMATQRPDTKVGGKCMELLVKSVLPATKADKEGAHKRLFEEIRAFDEVTLQRLAAGEISAEDLTQVDGVYIYSGDTKPSAPAPAENLSASPAAVSPAPPAAPARPRPVTGAV